MNETPKSIEGLPGDLANEILESIADGFYVLDDEWRFIHFNDRCERYFGVTRESVLGRAYLDVFPAARNTLFEVTLSRAKRTGEPQSFEGRSPVTGIPILLRAFPSRGRMTVVFTDVSERYEADEALKQSQQRYQSLFESLNEGFCVIEMIYAADGSPYNYRMLEVNPAFENQTGLKNAVGKTMREIAPNHESHWYETYGRVDRKRVPERFENWSEALGRWFEVSAFPVGDLDQHRIGVLFSDITQRKHSEAALRESEERFRVVAKATRDAIWDCHLATGDVWWNEGLHDAFGYAERETSNAWWETRVHEEDLPVVLDGLARVREQKAGHWVAEYRFRKADGSYAIVRDQGFLVRNDLGEPTRMVGAMTDLTEERRVTEVLRQQERRQRFLLEFGDSVRAASDEKEILAGATRKLGGFLEASRVGFAEVAEDGNTIHIVQNWTNGQVPDVTGYTGTIESCTPSFLISGPQGQSLVVHDIGQDQEARAHPSHYDDYEIRAFIRVPLLREGQFKAILFVHDQKPRGWLEHEIELVEECAARIWAAVERARATAALAASEARLDAITNSVDQIIWSTRADGYHDYFNQRWYEYTGMAEGSTDGMEWLGLFLPQDVARIQATWGESLRTGKPYFIEYRLRHHSGQYRWVIGRALPVFRPDGSIERWYGTCTDIHDLKMTEAALRESQDSLQQMNEALESRVAERTRELQEAVAEAEGFNYSVSHDLRAPIRAVSSTAAILLDELGDQLAEEYRTMLQRQRDNAVKLGRMVDELLRLSRLSRADVDRKELDLTDKARDVGEYELHDAPAGVKLEVQEGMVAYGDPILLRTLFHNLIGNAVKFSPNGGTIRVTQEGDVVSVSDEGVGFDMQYVDKIFRPFERLVHESEFPGTGISLANVERIIRRHNGKIWVESAPGKGTTFSFTL